MTVKYLPLLVLPLTFLLAFRVAVADETIAVSISKDGFTPTSGVASSTSFAFATQLIPSRPDGITKEPTYAGNTQYYGWLDLGSKENRRHYFCLDLQMNGKFLMYFDFDKNGDLTDDGAALENQGTGSGGPGGFSRKISIPWSHLSEDCPFEGNFDLRFYGNEAGWKKGHRVSHYSQTQLFGTVTIDGKKYNAVLVDTDYNDGDLTNDGIAIDLNSNGKFDADERPRTSYQIDGKTYKVEVTW